MTTPPNDLPRYALLTGYVGDAFHRQVSEALDMGYELYGSPAVTFDGKRMLLAQAVLWPGRTTTPAKVVPEATADSIVVPGEVADGTTP